MHFSRHSFIFRNWGVRYNLNNSMRGGGILLVMDPGPWLVAVSWSLMEPQWAPNS